MCVVSSCFGLCSLGTQVPIARSTCLATAQVPGTISGQWKRWLVHMRCASDAASEPSAGGWAANQSLLAPRWQSPWCSADAR